MRSADPVSISAPVNVGELTIEKFHTIPAAARALGVPTTKVRRAVKAAISPFIASATIGHSFDLAKLLQLLKTWGARRKRLR
jgi:hypothetical protein